MLDHNASSLLMLGQRWKSVPLNTVITIFSKLWTWNMAITMIAKALAMDHQSSMMTPFQSILIWYFESVARLCWAENVVAVEVAFLAAWEGFRWVGINIAWYYVIVIVIGCSYYAWEASGVWAQTLFLFHIRRHFAFKGHFLHETMEKWRNIPNEKLERPNNL